MVSKTSSSTVSLVVIRVVVFWASLIGLAMMMMMMMVMMIRGMVAFTRVMIINRRRGKIIRSFEIRKLIYWLLVVIVLHLKL